MEKFVKFASNIPHFSPHGTIRVIREIRVRKKLFVFAESSFMSLLPFGQWVYDKSREIRVQELFVFKKH